MAFSGNLVPDAISAEDYKQIPQELLMKIELYIKTLSDTNCALRDTWHTKEEQYETKISKYEQESAKFIEEVDKEREKQHVCELMLENTEAQLVDLKNELSTEKQHRKMLEEENTELCRFRDFARQESITLQSSLALSKVDVKRLEEKCKMLTMNLEQVTDAKYAALAECRDEKSAAAALQARCDKMELQLTTLRRHNQELTGSLNKYKDDLGRMRHHFCSRVAGLEAELVAKMEEGTKQVKIIDNLQTSLKKAESMVGKLGDRLNKQQEAEFNMKEGFQKELQSVTDVMNIYKGLSQEGESTVDEALSKAKEMSKQLEETVGLYKSVEEKLARTEAEFQKVLLEKDESLAAKEQEIKATYDLVAATIKEEMTEAVEKLPAGSDLRRQLQDCGSMANFIQHCSSLSVKLRMLKKENKLNVLYMKKVFEELEVKAPMIKKQQEEYKHAMNMVVQQSQQIDNMNEEIKQCHENEAAIQEQLTEIEKENYTLRSQVADLGKQVCNLLHEVERARTGVGEPSEDTSKNLIIFGNVEELQEQNRKLLELFAELNMPKENTEIVDDAVGLKFQECLSQYETQLKDVQEEVENYKTMTRSLTEERDTYRKLYQKLIYGRCGVYDEERETKNKPSDFSVEELTKQLTMLEQELTDLRMSSETYDLQQQVAEKAMLEEQKQLNEDLAKARDEAAQYYGELQVCQQKLRLQEATVNAARQSVATLERQNGSYCSRAADDKRAIKFHEEMAQKWEQKAGWQQQQAEQLRRELEKLRAAARGSGPLVGSGDCSSHLGERLTQLLQQMDAAGAALERREEERGASAQQQLSTAYQECLLLSRHLQEARNDLEDERSRLLLDLDTNFKKVVSEKKIRNALEVSLQTAQEEIERKSREIVELNRKLAESHVHWKPAPEVPQFSTSTPETDSWRRLAEDLEGQLAQKLGELKLLQLRLEEAQGQAATFSNMSEQFERQCKEEADQRRTAQELCDSRLSEARQLEILLRAEVQELTDRISRLPADGSEPSVHMQSQLDAMQAELQTTQHERDTLRDELHVSQQAVAALTVSLADMEKRYHEEEVVHMTDSQVVAKLKEELDNTTAQLAIVTAQKQVAVDAFVRQGQELVREQQEHQGKLSQLGEKLSDLEAQNCLLYDRLELLESRIPTKRPKLNVSGHSSANTSLSSSFMVEENQTPEQLMKIIQFLRKEKSVISSKLSTSRSENLALKVQLGNLEKQLLESKQDLVAAQKKVEVHVTAAREQEEKIKKVEMLFAMKDSNSMLREEREALTARVKKLMREQEQARQELEPLRAANKELQLRVDKLSVESHAARDEAARLRQQYGQLVESTARANQEERLRIQHEQGVLQGRLSEAMLDLQGAREQCDDLKQTVNDLQRRNEETIEEQTEKDKLWQTKLAAAHEECENKAKKLRETKNELKENAEIIRYLREKLSKSETELEDSLRKLKQMEEVVKKQEIEYKKKEDEYIKKEDEYKKKEDEYMKKEDEYKKKEDEYKKKEDEYKKNEDEYKKKEDEYKKNEDEYKKKEDEYKKKEDEYKKKEDEYMKKQDEYKKKLEECKVAETKAENDAVETALSQEVAGEQTTEDYEQASDKIDQFATPGPEVVVEETVVESSLDASSASPSCEQPASQSMGTVQVAPQESVMIAEPLEEPMELVVESCSSTEAAEQPTQQVLLAAPTSISAESTQAHTSQSIMQQELITTAGPQPGAKRSREADDDEDFSCDSSSKSPLQAKRTCTVENKALVEESIESVRDEVLSPGGDREGNLDFESKHDVSDEQDGKVDVLGWAEPIVPEPDIEISIVAEGSSDQTPSLVGEPVGVGHPEGSTISQASPESLPAEENTQLLLQPQEKTECLASGDAITSTSSQSASCVDTAGTTSLQLCPQETDTAVTEGDNISQLAVDRLDIPTAAVVHSSRGSDKPTMVTSERDVETTPDNAKFVNPLAAESGDGSRTPTPGSSEGRLPMQWPRGSRIVVRGMGPGRCRMISYRDSPLPVVLHRRPGGRPPVLRRMFRGRGRPFMRGHDRQ